MNRDEVRDLLESAWTHYDQEAERYKDVTHAVLKFTDFYRDLPEEARHAADEVVVEWALGDDENKQFIALAVIEDFSIMSALPALRELAERFENSREVSAPSDWAKVNRKIGRLAATLDQ